MSTEEKTFYKDYTQKITPKLFCYQHFNAKNINDLVILLNYCFLNKNNFFVDTFNKSVIKDISKFYNQLKTNILMIDISDIFNQIYLENFKPIRFIVINFINKYKIIASNNNELCGHISIEDAKSLLVALNSLEKQP
jgi:hypothetical protein